MTARRRSHRLATFLIVVVLLALAGAVAARLTTVVIPASGGVYTEGVAGSPSYINPILCQYNQLDQDLVALVFSGLTTTDASGVIIPDLAERWEISADGLRYTFHLRPDVRWHDGAPFTSADCKFTVQAIQDAKYQGPPELSNLWSSVQVDTPDAATVVFTLREPYAPFLEYTTQALLPAHVLASVPADQLPSSQFNAQPVGTGPYRVVGVSAKSVKLAANANYYGPQPHLARLEFVFYPDQASLFAARRRGEVQGIGHVEPDYLKDVRGDRGLSLYSAPFGGYTMVFLNLQRPVFQDAAVRKALLQGIDRQGLVDRYLRGQGLVLDGPILPNSWAYDPQLPRTAFDAKSAAQALEAAGWKDEKNEGVRIKGGVRLEFTLATNNDDPLRGQMIEEIAREWAQIGVKVHTVTLAMPELVRDHLYKRDYDAILYGWDLPAADPDPYPLWHSSQTGEDGQNYVGYKDATSDALLEQARRTSDYGQRTQLYRQFQQRFVAQTPSLLLYQPVYSYAIDKQVKGVQITPLLSTGDRFRNIYAWYTKTRRVLLSDAKSERQPIPTATRIP